MPVRVGCLERKKVRKAKSGKRVAERIARMIGTTSGWVEVATALTGQARFPEKEWRWPDLQSNDALLGEGSVPDPFRDRPISGDSKSWFPRKIKVRRITVSAISEPNI